MKALHLSTSDISGGAAIAAWRLHDGLRRSGVHSQMLVRRRVSNDGDVSAVSPQASWLDRVQRRLAEARLKAGLDAYRETLSPTLELFSDDRIPGPDPLRNGLPDADVINLHWVAQFVDYRRFFSFLSSDMPLVWTLHDMNPMTGGCHYSLACTRFTEECGACPQLGSNDEADLTTRIHARKHRALGQRSPENTRIVAPSHWLADEARRSSLLRRFEVDVIPYGLDTEIFCPRNRRVAREVFGLPQDVPLVLFVADNLNNHRKGFDLLEDALRALPSEQQVALAAVGGVRHGEVLSNGAISLGRIESPRLLSFAYSAADLFVLPTRADNLPNVALEAIACGTPVIGFDVGGVPDMVRPGITGLLSPAEDALGLRDAIMTMVCDVDLRNRLADTCRRVAVAEYALDIQARRYVKLYENLLARKAGH